MVLSERNIYSFCLSFVDYLLRHYQRQGSQDTHQPSIVMNHNQLRTKAVKMDQKQRTDRNLNGTKPYQSECNGQYNEEAIWREK